MPALLRTVTEPVWVTAASPEPDQAEIPDAPTLSSAHSGRTSGESSLRAIRNGEWVTIAPALTAVAAPEPGVDTLMPVASEPWVSIMPPAALVAVASPESDCIDMARERILSPSDSMWKSSARVTIEPAFVPDAAPSDRTPMPEAPAPWVSITPPSALVAAAVPEGAYIHTPCA